VSFSQLWAPLLTWSIELRNHGEKDADGNPVMSDPITVKAHVDQVTTGELAEVRPDIETVRQTDTVIYFGADNDFDGREPEPGTEVTFPSSKVVQLVQVILHYDDKGVAHHYECTAEELS
jgi:hypothetical protein